MHDHGLQTDLETLLTLPSSRRTSLRWLLLGAASLPILGCGGSADGSSNTGSTSNNSNSGNSGSTGNCSVIPEETGGPYPGDGSNSNSNGVVNVLTMSGIVRKDIRSSFNGASAVADGIPLTINLKINNASSSCAAAAGYTVYLWHCDKDGNYSLYSAGLTNQNYLRGVQVANANGELSFTTIYPGCYAGRVPHVHFEIFPSLERSTSVANRLKTSQLTFPSATSQEAYSDSRYSASVRNLAQISFATDNVFSDGTALQMASISGNVRDGYVASLTINV